MPEILSRTCTKCKETKSLSMFSKKEKTGKYNLQPRCKPCAAEDTRVWRELQSPERIKDLYYRRNYGMGLDEFNTRLANQQGKCKICDRTLSLEGLTGDRVVVDHCHTSGLVRGLLCNECNRGLGYFRDNKEALIRAARYLMEQELSPKGG